MVVAEDELEAEFEAFPLVESEDGVEAWSSSSSAALAESS